MLPFLAAARASRPTSSRLLWNTGPTSDATSTKSPVCQRGPGALLGANGVGFKAKRISNKLLCIIVHHIKPRRQPVRHRGVLNTSEELEQPLDRGRADASRLH